MLLIVKGIARETAQGAGLISSETKIVPIVSFKLVMLSGAQRWIWGIISMLVCMTIGSLKLLVHYTRVHMLPYSHGVALLFTLKFEEYIRVHVMPVVVFFYVLNMAAAIVSTVVDILM